MRRIALTAGEPAGIGVDLCIQLAQHPTLECEIVVLADVELLEQRAKHLHLPLTIRLYDPHLPAVSSAAGELCVLPISLAHSAQAGILNKANSGYVLALLDRATQGCISGEFSAMVTAPVHKGIINEARMPFTGHTEYIANITQGHPVMMLATEGLRVALVTTHLPLSKVSEAITPDTLESVIRILHHDLIVRFGIAQPTI